MLSKATVVGAGAMGTVMAQILAGNGVHVALLASRPERVEEFIVARENTRYLPGVRLSPRIKPTADSVRAFLDTELIIASVPSQHLRAVLKANRPALPAGAPVCSVIKGIEISTGARPSEIIAEFLPHSMIAVLSGPSIAAELAKCLPATVVVASEHAALADQLQELLSTTWFRVYTNSDVRGVEYAGALKNIIAIAAGILDGLRAGDNAKAALITRGLVEISRFGVAMGGKPETFAGLAGVGDLVTTCVSPHGRNRTAGEQIGEGVPVAEVIRESKSVIEGIPTTEAVMKLAERHGVEMPITQAVYSVLFHGVAPLDAITALMRRPRKSEGRT